MTYQNKELIFTVPVIAPAEISNYEYDYIMITSIFVLQIQDQLINELKVAKSRIKAVPKSVYFPKIT